jgi:transposase
MVKLTFTVELDEEQLRDLFEERGIKFSKKKVKDLQEELNDTADDIQSVFEENFEEIVDEAIEDMFGE